MSSKENKDNASTRDMVAPSGQGGIIMDFIRVRKSFQSLVSEISSDMIDDVGNCE